MKSRAVSILISILMVTNIIGAIAQNVGVPNSSLSPTGGLPLSNISTPIPQTVGQLSSSSSGTGGLADSPWPMFRGNLNHTGLSPYDTSGNNGQLKWSIDLGNNIVSSPAIGSDGTIYVGCRDYKLYAINPNGSVKWSFNTGNFISLSSPAIGYDGTIYIGSYDHKIYAINPDGTEKWNFTAGAEIESSPTIGSDGTIYIGSNDNKIYAINHDGSEKWSYVTGARVTSSAAVCLDGTIYIGSWDNHLYAINPDGSEKWRFDTGDLVSSSPAIGSEGTIYFASDNNKLYAINPDGTQKWDFMMIGGDDMDSSPAIGSDGTIYVGSSNHWLYAVNPNGTEKWNFSTLADVESSPAIGSDGMVYVGTDCDWTGYPSYAFLYAFYPNGTVKWKFGADNDLKSSPAIGSDGTIYIGSNNQKLYAIGIPNQPPVAVADSEQTGNEGYAVQFDGLTSYDPDGIIETYEWDFDISDGLWWETGVAPDATGPTSLHTYGDNGAFVATLRVSDNEGALATDTCNITVLNVNPTITIESITMDVEIGLSVAGRKYNDVGMTLYENGTPIGHISIERMPGSPDEQIAWIPISIDFSKSYNATVTYTPEDPPNVGGNPVWIYIKSQNGSINKIHHTFNVQQSKKRDSEHWNHVEPWEVDLSGHFIGLPFEITSHITDPGSDDETLTYTYGSQIKTVTYLKNPPNPDPYPSPEVNPVDIMDTTTLVYEGPGTVYLTVNDDDGGIGTHTIII